jgi:hypothetical protein
MNTKHISSSVVFFGIGVGAVTVAGIIQAIRWAWDPFLAPLAGSFFDQ